MRWTGQWDEALENYRKGVEFETPGAFHGWSEGVLVTHLARLGRAREVQTLFEEKKGILEPMGRPRTLGEITLALGLIEATWMIGLTDATTALRHVVDDALPTGVLYHVFDCRTMQLLAALAYDAAGDGDRAEEHFDAATEIARSDLLVIEEADICLYRATSLMRRGEPPDGDSVRTFVERATMLLEGCGMERYLDLMKNTLSLP